MQCPVGVNSNTDCHHGPPYPLFTSLSEAIQWASDIVKSELSVEGEVSEVKCTCIQMFNTQWAIKAIPLGIQIQYLLKSLNTATKYTPEELSIEPG